MKIKTSHFCALSSSQDWRDWLQAKDNDLYKELMDVVEQRKSCRVNKEIMMKIYHQLYKRGHGQDFEDFVSHRFPYIVEAEQPNVLAQRKRAERRANRKRAIRKTKRLEGIAASNRHGVFKSYNPGLLTFPQKMIIQATDDLQNKVSKFIANKVGVDYIIIDDTAYIEYFHPKYASVVDDIPRQERDIHKYRMSLNE